MNPFDRLAFNLESQLENYNRLIDLELIKVESLYQNDIEKLKTITDQEEELLKTLTLLERERIALVSAMGFSGMTMSQILPRIAPSNEKQRLNTTFSQLRQTLSKLKETNGISKNLTEIRIRDTELAIKAMTPPPKLVVYNHDGTVQKNEPEKEKSKHTFKNQRI